MDRVELPDRTRDFAVRVFRLLDRVPDTQASSIIVNQLLRSASSVAANYRAVNRAKSRADFGNKLKIVLEEVDECNFWLGFGKDVTVLDARSDELGALIKESDELTSIFAAAVRTFNKSKQP